MRKRKVGYQFTVYLDDKTSEVIIKFAARECRSPENAIQYLLQKKIEEEKGKKNG